MLETKNSKKRHLLLSLSLTLLAMSLIGLASLEPKQSRKEPQLAVGVAIPETWVTLLAPTTTIPVTTIAPYRKATVRPSRGASYRGSISPATGNDIWRALANCESALGNDSKNGKYHGYFQFSLATWRSVGETGDPHTYSYEHQKAAAIRLQARSGWGQWPVCSRKLGLR